MTKSNEQNGSDVTQNRVVRGLRVSREITRNEYWTETSTPGQPVRVVFAAAWVTTNVSEEIPADVRAVFLTLLVDARENVKTGDLETLRSELGSIKTVARNKLPPGDVQDSLCHGCDKVEQHAPDEPAVADEYLRSMTTTVKESPWTGDPDHSA
jgi:hypothetical protein